MREQTKRKKKQCAALSKLSGKLPGEFKLRLRFPSHGLNGTYDAIPITSLLAKSLFLMGWLNAGDYQAIREIGSKPSPTHFLVLIKNDRESKSKYRNLNKPRRNQ